MAVNGKRKGKAGELELSRKLKEYGYNVRRSVQYNGKAEEGEADLLGLPGLHIECKRVERLNIQEAMEQARRDSAETGRIPAVFHRKNHCEWLVTMRLEDFMPMYAEFEAAQALKGGEPDGKADDHNGPCEGDS